MSRIVRFALLPMLLAAAAQAETPEKFLRSVPLSTEACVQECSATELACSAKAATTGRKCDAEMRLCVQRCDPQLMNSALLEELERSRRQQSGVIYQSTR